jgi:hypothetical protein
VASLNDDPEAQAGVKRVRGTLTAPLPAGWWFKESLTVFPPQGGANVIASSEPVSSELDTKAYAEQQASLLREEFPGFKEHVFEPATLFGGRDGYIRRFEWTPDGSPVVQIQIYYVEDGRAYTATATTTSGDFEKFELVLTEIIDGLLIESGNGSPGSVTLSQQGGAANMTTGYQTTSPNLAPQTSQTSPSSE